MAKIILVVVSLFTFISYCRYLYKKDKEDEDRMKYRELEGDWTGFECFYYCSPKDIIEYERHFNETERVCTELDNYTVYKL